MVSAIRVDGKRLHELAREGIEVERAAPAGHVDRFDVRRPTIRSCCTIEVECSAGTYIRSLAADLGTLLGGGAHLRGLRRTAVGASRWPRRAGPDECSCCSGRRGCASTTLVSIVDDATAELIANGRVLDRWADGPWAVFGARRGSLRSASCYGDASEGRRRRQARGRARPLSRRRHERAGARRAIAWPQDGRAASCGVQTSSISPPPWQGAAHRHHASARTTACTVGHQAVIAAVRRAPRQLGARVVGRHLRPPSGVGRPPGVGAAAAHRASTRSSSCSRRPVSTPTVVIHFDEPRRHESPERFVERVLVGCLATQLVVVGDDFHFGRNRSGNVALLASSARSTTSRCIPSRSCRAPTGSTSRSAPRPSAGRCRRRRRDRHDDARPPVRGARAGDPGDQRGRRSASRRPTSRCPTLCLPADGVYAGWYVRPDGERAPVRDQPRPAPDVLRARRPLAARGPPARLRRRPLRRTRRVRFTTSCAASASSTGSTR